MRGCKCSGIAQNKGIQNIRVTAIALMEHFETVKQGISRKRRQEGCKAAKNAG